MKLLTKNTDYAVRALIYIARKREGVISVAELTDELSISRAFLRKILQSLQKRGFLSSFKGKGGGFQLALPSDQIFLSDIVETFQGPVKMCECIFKKKICPNVSVCPLKQKLEDIQKTVIKELRSVTLSELSNARGA